MSMQFEDNHIVVYNPSSRQEVGRLEISTENNIKNSINRAKEYKDWSLLPLKKRCKIINSFRKAAVKHEKHINFLCQT